MSTITRERYEMEQRGNVPGAPGAYGGYGYHEPSFMGIPHRLISPRHLVAAIISLIVLIFAAVGLGQVDWYVIENTNVAGNYMTWFFGLNYFLACPTPAGTPNGRHPQYNQFDNAGAFGTGTGTGTTGTAVTGGCVLYRYRSWRYNDHDNFQHLIGASGVIIALLSLLIIVSFVSMLINLIAAFHRHYTHSFRAHDKARHHRGGKALLAIMMVLELLVIIFWVTIFPYRYVYDLRSTAYNPTYNTAGYDSYFTLGTGFSVQIAGFFLTLLGMALLRRRYNNDNHNVALPPAQQQQVVTTHTTHTTQPVVVASTIPATTV